MISQVRQTGPQCFKLPRGTALQTIHNPQPSEKPIWCHFKRNQARQILAFLFESSLLTGRERGSCPLPLWEGKEIATALPLETQIQTTASKERELTGAVRKREQYFSICVLETGTLLMWLRYMKRIAGCRITRQELPAWAIVMKMFQKPQKETNNM